MIDFDPKKARQSLHESINHIVEKFTEKNPSQDTQIEKLILKQIFNSPAAKQNLFWFFIENSQNRNSPVSLKEEEWKNLEKAFKWRPSDFRQEYVEEGQPNELNQNFEKKFYDKVTTESKRGTTSHLKFFQTIADTAIYFDQRRQNCAQPSIDQLLDKHFAYIKEKDSLEVNTLELWKAIFPIHQNIYNVGAQVVLNFLRDAGCDYAVKPDTHIQKTVSKILFPEHGLDWDEQIGERNSIEIVMRFAKAAGNQHYRRPKGECEYKVTPAAIDRLIWLNGSGRLMDGKGEKYLTLTKQGPKRRKQLGKIMHDALKVM